MTKKSQHLLSFAIIAVLATLTPPVAAQVNTACYTTHTADITFPFPSGPSVNPGGTLSIPYDTANNSKNMRVTVAPHVYNALNTGVWATKLQIKVDGTATSPEFDHTNGSGASNVTLPFSSFTNGPHAISVWARCINGGGSLAKIATMNINKQPGPSVSTISVAPECCTVTSGPQHVISFTGQQKFKISVASGSIVASALNVNGSMETLTNGGYIGCYSSPVNFSVVDSSNTPVPGSKVNGQAVFHYVKPRAACLDLNAMQVNPRSIRDALEAQCVGSNC